MLYSLEQLIKKSRGNTIENKKFVKQVKQQVNKKYGKKFKIIDGYSAKYSYSQKLKTCLLFFGGTSIDKNKELTYDRFKYSCDMRQGFHAFFQDDIKNIFSNIKINPNAEILKIHANSFGNIVAYLYLIYFLNCCKHNIKEIHIMCLSPVGAHYSVSKILSSVFSSLVAKNKSINFYFNYIVDSNDLLSFVFNPIFVEGYTNNLFFNTWIRENVEKEDNIFYLSDATKFHQIIYKEMKKYDIKRNNKIKHISGIRDSIKYFKSKIILDEVPKKSFMQYIYSLKRFYKKRDFIFIQKSFLYSINYSYLSLKEQNEKLNSCVKKYKYNIRLGHKNYLLLKLIGNLIFFIHIVYSVNFFICNKFIEYKRIKYLFFLQYFTACISGFILCSLVNYKNSIIYISEPNIMAYILFHWLL